MEGGLALDEGGLWLWRGSRGRRLSRVIGNLDVFELIYYRLNLYVVNVTFYLLAYGNSELL